MSRLPRVAAGLAVVGVVTLGLGLWAARVAACPFCSAVSLTFSEEIANSQVAVIAKLVQAPPKSAAAAGDSLEVTKSKFEIVKILKGADALGKQRTFDVAYFGDSAPGATFLVMGIDPPNINWGTPIAMSERGQEYVAKAMDLPKEGPDRLAFFQDYLEDKEEMLARDAYDEFAKAPYSMVLALKDRMKHDKIVEWTKSTQIPVSRRRLYMTMLGVCGTPADLPTLEAMITSKDRQTKEALDALVAAWLTLKGPDGLPLVEDLFLKNKDAEYTDTYATIMALRFHGTEEKIVPRDKLLASIRTMLDRPQLADLVIPDLARWEDWSVMDRLVELFKNADDESSWVRVPVVNYLRACPLPKAKVYLDELAKLDPETMKRASSFFPLAGTPTTGATSADRASDSKSVAADKAATDKTAADKATSEKTASEKAADKPAANTGAAVAPASAPAASTAEQPKPDNKDQSAGDKAAAAVPGAATRDGATSDIASPGPPASSLPVYGGLAAAAVLLACAFWAILKGGQQSPA